MNTEFEINVGSHDKLHANKLRIICDRFGLIAPEGEQLEAATSTQLGFSLFVEAYDNENVIASRQYQGVYEGQQNPYVVLKTIALNLFPNSKNQPLVEAQ